MKTLKTYTLAIILMMSVTNITLAHFGSKGPYGGSVSCGITNDTIVYLGTTDGGVFFSTRQGLTGWSCKPVGLKSGKITALAHTGMGSPTSYTTGVVVFAGTADSGVFRYTGLVGSSDRYWEKVNTGLTNLNVKSLLALGTNTLVVGTNGGGVFKTTDNGATWAASNTGLSGTAVITGLVKAGTRIIATAQAGGLFKSDDNGSTWSTFNDVNTLNIAGTNALSYNVTTDELMVVNNTGLFVIASASTASSYSYTASQTGLPVNTVVRSISNNGTNWYLATDGGVYTSATGTISWASANTGLTTMDVHVVVPVAFSSSRLVVGTSKEGIFKTAASSVSWTLNNSTGFNNQATYAMVTNGDLLVVAATAKGVFVSKDLAANYTKANTGLTDSLNVTDFCFANGCIVAATKNAGVFFSLDSGKTAWLSASVGLTNLNIKKVFCDNLVKYAICSNGNVYKSPLYSYSWTMISQGLPVGVNPTSLTFYGNTLLLTTSAHGVYTREANGSTWTAANSGLSNLNVTSATVNGNRLYIGTYGSGVFKSDTAAIYWAAVTPLSISHTTMIGLDGTKVQAMASDGNFVFASYKGGLLATSDEGETWIAGGNQFNLPSFTNVNKISFVTTRVFVSTDNNGLYSNALSELPLVAKAFVTTEASDHDACDGEATVVVSGGATPYTYAWSTGASTASVTGLCSETYTVIVTDNAAKKDTVTVEMDHHHTGIEDSQAAINVNVYPNPNNGAFTITVNSAQQTKSVEIYTIAGMLVAQIPVDGVSNIIPVKANLPQGIYMVKITTQNNSSVYSKIIVQ